MAELMNKIKKDVDPIENGYFENKFKELQQPHPILLTEKESVLKVISEMQVPVVPAIVDDKLFLKTLEIQNQFKVWKANAIKQITDLK